MVSILLAIIYISFISLGLPDSLLGSAWPSMYQQLGVPVSYAGVVSMIIAGGTILSSLFSDKLIHRIGTGMVTAISVGMTAVALFGFSVSNSFLMLCLWGIPYGLGAGSVDAALNNYVALHYKAKHMSWLHCFWGVGATMGPYIMGACLTGGLTWNSGYRSISIIQIVLTAVLVVSLPLWKQKQDADVTGINEFGKGEVPAKSIGLKEAVQLPGAKAVLVAFFCYCALESTTGLWGASYMVAYRGMSTEAAAKWASLFYLGITAGRFISGFITMRMTSKQLIRLGQGIIILGVLLLILPFGNMIMCAGFILIGMGCAPIYPCLLHETPHHFGAAVSQSIMGIQMACAYIGTTLMPPLFGIIASQISISVYPFYLVLFVLLMIVMVEKLNKVKRAK